MNYFIIYSYFLCSLKIEVIGSAMSKVVFPNEESDEDFTYGNSPTRYDGKFPHEHSKPQHKFPIDETIISCSTNETLQFCENDENKLYPTEYIESLLNKTFGKHNEYFDEVMNRDDFSDESESINLCEIHRRKFYPRVAKNEEHDWQFIINLPKYHQPIRVELCQEASSQCLFSEYFPIGYSSSCTQKYSKIPLIGLDANGDIFISEYEYPSHCNCDLLKVK